MPRVGAHAQPHDDWLTRFAAQFELAMKLPTEAALVAIELIRADLREKIREIDSGERQRALSAMLSSPDTATEA